MDKIASDVSRNDRFFLSRNFTTTNLYFIPYFEIIKLKLHININKLLLNMSIIHFWVSNFAIDIAFDTVFSLFLLLNELNIDNKIYIIS